MFWSCWIFWLLRVHSILVVRTCPPRWHCRVIESPSWTWTRSVGESLTEGSESSISIYNKSYWIKTKPSDTYLKRFTEYNKYIMFFWNEVFVHFVHLELDILQYLIFFCQFRLLIPYLRVCSAFMIFTLRIVSYNVLALLNEHLAIRLVLQ